MTMETLSPTRRATYLIRRVSPIWAATVVLFAVSPLIAPGSLNPSALQAMVPFASLLAVAAVGQTLVMQQRGLDLSVPGAVMISAVMVATYTDGDPDRLLVGILLALGVCVAGGLIIGTAVTYLRLTALVASLGVNSLYVGAALLLTEGASTSRVPTSLSDFSLGSVGGVSNIAIVCIIVVAIAAFLSAKTVVGRRLLLLGANPAAALVSGVPVRRYTTAMFVAAALCYALAGILLAGFLQTPSLAVGDSYLLSTLTAVVLGGAAIATGAAVLATAGGALFLTQLEQVVLGTGAPTYSQYFVQGLVIAVAMLLQGDLLRQRAPWRRLGHLLSRQKTKKSTVTP